MKSIALCSRAVRIWPVAFVVIGCERLPTSWSEAPGPSFSIVVGNGAWTTAGSMPTARRFLAVGVVNGVIYAVGGDTSTQNGLDEAWDGVEAYDPVTNAWMTRASMPTARSDLGVGVVDGVLYAIGGADAGGAPLDVVEAYDPATDTWTTKAPMPTARGGVRVGVVDGVLYAIGGDSAGSAHSHKVEAYDPATDSWQTKAPMPTARGAFALGVVSGVIYVVGGDHAGQGDETGTNQAYSPMTDTWTTRASMPTARGAPGVGVVNGVLYAIGGQTGCCSPTVVNEAYDPVANVWTRETSMPTARSFLGVGVVDGILYAIGGVAGPGQFLSATEVFTPNLGVTPTGSDVTVTTPQGVTLTFESVMAEGQTTVTTSGAGAPPPTGFQLGDPAVYFDINTTAIFSGVVTICIDYSGIQFAASTVSLFHLEDGIWVDRTISVEATNKVVCAEVASLSPFLIAGDIPPTVGTITAPIAPVQVNTVISASASFTDQGIGAGGAHAASISWGDGVSSVATVSESNGSGSASGSHSYATAGVYTVTLTVTDEHGTSGQSSFRFIVVFDPSAGFATGGGWITSPVGAYVPNQSLSGKATFGFVSRYLKGATAPTGNTDFVFQAASFRFRGTNFDWLVISGARAQFKGSGTVNGTGNYGFLLTAVDGAIGGGGGVDRFRLKVWDRSTGIVIYDNQMGADQAAEPTTAIGGGDIVIHS